MSVSVEQLTNGTKPITSACESQDNTTLLHNSHFQWKKSEETPLKLQEVPKILGFSANLDISLASPIFRGTFETFWFCW